MPADIIFTVGHARLPDDLPLLRCVRQQVFIEAQGIPVELEWNGQDETSVQVKAASLYQCAGFTITGDVVVEAGIEPVCMDKFPVSDNN